MAARLIVYMTIQQSAMMMPVERRMLPMPVSGETIPPKRNCVNPNRAEALPALLRSRSRASAVEVGITMPKKNIMIKSNPSTTIKERLPMRAIAVASPRTKNIVEPTRRAIDALAKRGVSTLDPIMMAKAFAPKQMLYRRGEI